MLVAVFQPPAVATGGTDLTNASPGAVIQTGTLVNGACEFPQGSASIALNDTTTRVQVTLAVTSSCELVVAEVCKAPSVCVDPEPGATHYPAEDEPGGGEPSPQCHQTKAIRSQHWTEGYGYDDLSGQVVDMRWYYNCSNGAVLHSLTRDCWIGPVGGANGWHKHWCYIWRNYDAPATAVENGINGDYGCHNNNICANNHYKHWLATDIDGWNNGQGYCDYSWDGTLPPYRRIDCRWTT